MDDILLPAGLGALALGLAIAGATLVLATGRRNGVARALADIDQLYAPSGPGHRTNAISDRVVRPILRAMTLAGHALTPPAGRAWIRRWLDYAGNPPAWPPARVHEAQGLGLVTVGFLATVVALAWSYAAAAPIVPTMLAAAVVGGVAGLYLPLLVLSHFGQQRQERIQVLLPDALDMLTLCVEAGLPFDAALVRVATGTQGPLAREVARVLHETQMGKQRGEAMRAMAARTTVPELRTMATAIVQGTELGIPLAEVLREQARDMRIRRRQRAEETARKVPVKILFPLVLCLFPALFIVILGPGLLRIMDSLL